MTNISALLPWALGNIAQNIYCGHSLHGKHPGEDKAEIHGGPVVSSTICKSIVPPTLFCVLHDQSRPICNHGVTAGTIPALSLQGRTGPVAGLRR